ncbi:DUF4249 domain-containing protein [Rhodocytophaga aerolata]|uniref:DUF4249 domain-containing protein n=1 Tax=Rhodocytophaga aerolata TaxID=455078 RepID=A0ABT8RCD2_9BACT|nr:DUF4249 domain-containing protein [Rhodocytophaga aerolata]MDO1449761.1 DUF4249 domain-containing protein [Rhodocytophaga aerolata]
MNLFIKYSFGLLAILLLPACEKEIDLAISGQPQLVVNSLFTPDSLWSVHVSKSVPVVSPNPPSPVNDATIQLFEDGVLLEELTRGVNGLYTSTTHKPMVGKTYELQVRDQALGQATARERMEVEKVAIVDARYVAVRDAKHEYPVSVKVKDPAGVSNFYVVKVYGVEEKGDIYIADTRSDDLAASSKEASITGIGFSDALFDGKEYSLQLKLFYGYPKLIIELQNVSPAYYQYHYTQQLQGKNTNDPFSTPTEVYTNISQGLGIFASYQADTMHVLPEQK